MNAVLDLARVAKPPDKIKEFFDLYFSYIGESEAPIIYHRWSILGTLSAILARNVWLKFGQGAIYPNLYLFLIGEPGARKSTAIGASRKAIKSTGFNLLSAARTSPEKFICDLEENGLREGGNCSQIFIAEDEFLDFIGKQNENFISLLTKLSDNHDNFPYRLKNSTSVDVYAPTISILGGCTHATFSEAFPPGIINTGLLSRMLLIYSEKTRKKITWPTGASTETKNALGERLKELRLFHSGQISITPDANKIIDDIYQSFQDLEDPRFAHYCSRRHDNLLKICIIMASIESSLTLRSSHVIWANTLLCSIEDRFSKALGEFGKSKNADTSSKIMNALYETDIPLTAVDLLKVVQTDIDSIVDLNKIITGLFASNRIMRSGEGYLATKSAVKNLKYTDFDLLDASEIPSGAFERKLL